jgi:DNA-binding transcriptional ArsR family regulator
MPVSPATFAGLLADEDRLRVFAAVALGARTVADVARAAELDETAVQNALPRLVQAGLIEQRDGLCVSLSTLQAAARERPQRERGAADATSDE